MENIAIKKYLYKQKPLATLEMIRIGVAYYKCKITDNTGRPVRVNFEVPISDMGEADFLKIMESQHLNRWITTTEEWTIDD